MLKQTNYKNGVTCMFFNCSFGTWENPSKRTCKKTNYYTNDVDDDNSEETVPHVGQFVEAQIPRPENRQTITYFKLYNFELQMQKFKYVQISTMCFHDSQYATCICREVHGNDHSHLDIFLVKMCLAGNE